MSGDAGFGVYVHWPFCAAKCPYCDFNSHVRHNGVDQADYAKAYVAEIAHMASLAPGKKVRSIFFGGGTPSLMEPATAQTIIDAIAGHWSLEADAEITLEANPTSVEADRFTGYRAAGVNRVSLGVQSLYDEDLKALGRLHSGAEAMSALDIAQRIFPRVSFDLIYARPRQTPEMWQRELATAITRGTEHLSLYQLTIEEGTPFAALFKAGKLQMPDEDTARAFWDVTQDLTGQAGLPAYEISNHARPGAESRHNLVYWRSGEWAGIGPGAHGRLGDDDRRLALTVERNPEHWRQRVAQFGHGLVTEERLDIGEIADEFLVMGLRLAEGVDLARYRRLTGEDLDPVRIKALVDDGLIEALGADRLRVTPSGFPVLDAVVADLAA
ncbi:coproporphyrinogen III oxidase [Agaricicola taiwanensis]|uniref:Heme chaperone HemW n=1 Tax=Agaricicola taiwanensis TaxID=591372 RepID=A0A8J2YD55_9RHOB|nr:radical SAM family heme chaperone HemW [Agaricicola taiwanensis]GGE32746.1 coproporphyrinogen III oxidase [Agaricicola taiwanensis]